MGKWPQEVDCPGNESFTQYVCAQSVQQAEEIAREEYGGFYVCAGKKCKKYVVCTATPTGQECMIARIVHGWRYSVLITVACAEKPAPGAAAMIFEQTVTASAQSYVCRLIYDHKGPAAHYRVLIEPSGPIPAEDAGIVADAIRRLGRAVEAADGDAG
jgi:hypothetical protein